MQYTQEGSEMRITLILRPEERILFADLVVGLRIILIGF
jgi:hypothetical protein